MEIGAAAVRRIEKVIEKFLLVKMKAQAAGV
jgi:hypothetical protein